MRVNMGKANLREREDTVSTGIEEEAFKNLD